MVKRHRVLWLFSSSGIVFTVKQHSSSIIIIMTMTMTMTIVIVIIIIQHVEFGVSSSSQQALSNLGFCIRLVCFNLDVFVEAACMVAMKVLQRY